MYVALVGTWLKAGKTPAGWGEPSAPDTAFYDARCPNPGFRCRWGQPRSIGGDPGLLDDFGPQRDVGLDDIGELSERRALGLAAGHIQLLAHIGGRHRPPHRPSAARADRRRRDPVPP